MSIAIVQIVKEMDWVIPYVTCLLLLEAIEQLVQSAVSLCFGGSRSIGVLVNSGITGTLL